VIGPKLSLRWILSNNTRGSTSDILLQFEREQPPKPLVILVVGKSNSGKTTVSKALAKSLGCIHLDIAQQIKLQMEAVGSTTNEVRSFAASGEAIGEAVAMRILDNMVHTEEGVFKGK
jgi:cytidylate kinase